MNSEPRNFTGEYPLAGERLGPAWRMTWRLLSHEWTPVGPLAARVAAASEVVPGTVRTLLYAAAKAGMIERRCVGRPGRQVAEVRVVEEER